MGEGKQSVRFLLVLLLGMIGILGTVWMPAEKAYARDCSDVIREGIYIDEIDVSGLTQEEAQDKIIAFVDMLKQRVVTFGAVDEHYVAITVGDLGLEWQNTQVVEEAVGHGKEGNIVKRYKAIQDLKHGNKVFELELGLNEESLRTVLTEQCAEYDIPAVNASLIREDGVFHVKEGEIGQSVNIEESLAQIMTYLLTSWDYQDASIDLVIDITEPKGSQEELVQVKDVLGTYTTSYSTSGKARSKNVENGCELINGTTLYPGEEFSTLQAILPFTEENGYYPAGSYLNGMVVDSLGGGICQVSTTLYNAILLSELETTNRSSHSMIISYVEPSMDAAIAESSGKDYCFKNNTEYPVYIEGYTENKKITFVVYGVETRDAGRKVRFESEILETIYPDSEKIIKDASQGIGFIDIQSAHIGYKARLWKIVEQDGVEISRDIMNRSTYQVSPRTATVGVATGNADYASRMQNAINTGSIDTVKAEIAAIQAEIAAAQEQAKQQAILEQQMLQNQQQPVTP